MTTNSWIKDLKVDVFSNPGRVFELGATSVRLTYLPLGLKGESSEEKSSYEHNKSLALLDLCGEFVAHINLLKKSNPEIEKVIKFISMFSPNGEFIANAVREHFVDGSTEWERALRATENRKQREDRSPFWEK